MKAEQRPARPPDSSGAASRDGVSLHFDVYGDAATTVMLLPTWSVVPSRFWKLQVAFLARHYRVVTFDGRGSGRSSRPRGAAAFADHGTDDRLRSAKIGERLAELTGGRLTLIEAAGHGLTGRDPVRINTLIR